MNKLKFLIMALLLFIGQGSYAEQLKIVTSFTILKDMVEQVAGEKADVVSLVGVDGSPHDFEASPQDLLTIKNADVVVLNGLGLEGRLDEIISSAGFKGKLVIASAGIKPLLAADEDEDEEEHGQDKHEHEHEHEGAHAHEHEHAHGGVDPHAWNSLSNGVTYVNNIITALVKVQPSEKNYFITKGNAYIAQLKQLDARLKTQFAALANKQKNILTSHDAFGYFAQAYGVNFVSPMGLSAKEVSAKQMAELINQFKQQQVKIYFLEDQINPKLVEQIAKATGAKLGGTLYPESLSAADGPAATYLAAFTYNAAKLLEALK